MADENDYNHNDPQYTIWRKMLNRLSQLVSGGPNSTVTLTASDLEIGAVEIKNGTDDTRAVVATAAPGVGDAGLVVRIAGGGSGDGAILDGVNSAIKATVFDLPNSNPVATQLVDANGDAVSVGGGTQYAEDTASTAGEQLTMAGVVRQDTPGSLVDADGDRTELQVNADGALRTDGSAVTQPVSAASLPLPTGAATEATLATRVAAAQLPAALVGGRLDVNIGGQSGAITIAEPVSVDDNGASLTVDSTQLPAALVGGRLDTNVGAWLGSTAPTVGQKVAADSVPVTLASDQPAVAVDITAVAYGGTFATRDSDLIADNGAFTDGTSRIRPVGFTFDEVAGTALTENDIAAARIDSKRAQVCTIEDETTRGRRVTVTAANALKVDASSVAVPVTDNSGSLTVDNNGTFAIQDSEKIVDNAGFTDGASKVQPAGYIFDETAGTALTENDAAAARVDSKRAQVIAIEDATTRGQRLAVNASGHASVALKPQASGGLTTFHLVSAATTNATNIKASAGQVFGWYIYNSNAAPRKVAFHNASGTPTAGASIFFSLVIPAGSGANVFSEQGMEFSTGIAITTVTGLADSDSTAVAANDLVINIWYK